MHRSRGNRAAEASPSGRGRGGGRAGQKAQGPRWVLFSAHPALGEALGTRLNDGSVGVHLAHGEGAAHHDAAGEQPLDLQKGESWDDL